MRMSLVESYLATIDVDGRTRVLDLEGLAERAGLPYEAVTPR
jgi:hypothetical protein